MPKTTEHKGSLAHAGQHNTRAMLFIVGENIAAVREEIDRLHSLGYVGQHLWSPIIPNPSKPGTVMAVLSR